jgi:potassium voltage-gated channel Eag-related subfamily H protein 8
MNLILHLYLFTLTTYNPSSHPLTSPFTKGELTMAMSSRSSSATGLDLISINMLKHISEKEIDILLTTIFNFLWLGGIVPESRLHFHVIFIPQPNTTSTAYRPIALSSALCKLVEYILRNRLDW